MYASSFKSKKINGLAECATTQLDLFDHSVSDHTVAARLLCPHHAPKARCMMTIENTAKVRKTYPQQWHEYNLAQTNEKARLQELLFDLCTGVDDPPQAMGRPRAPLSDVVLASCLKVYECM